MIHCSLWDRYPSLGTIITSDKRGALAVKSHQIPNPITLSMMKLVVYYSYVIISFIENLFQYYESQIVRLLI